MARRPYSYKVLSLSTSDNASTKSVLGYKVNKNHTPISPLSTVGYYGYTRSLTHAGHY